jgi:hypothetical protein
MAVAMAVVVAGGVTLSLTAQKAISQIRAALTKNVDEPGRLPYQAEVDFGGCSGGNSFCIVAFPPVPAGKRLVVEEVTALAFVRNGGQVNLFAFGDGVITNTGNVAIMQPTFTPLFAADSFSVAWSIDKQIKVYYEPGTTPKVKIQASVGFGALGSNMTLHGYLIDATN